MGVSRGLLFILLLRTSLCSPDGCGTLFGEDKYGVARGVQGPPGKAGASGTVDYEKVREIIADEQKRENKELRVELEQVSQKFSVLSKENKELRAELDEVKERLETVERQTNYSGPCEIYYSGKCFSWIWVSSSGSVDYAKAETECTKHGSRVADIYGQDHFKIVANKTREVSGGNLRGIVIWTAMTYDVTADVVSLSNGNLAPSLRWYRKSRSTSNTRIGLVIRNPPNDGILNYKPTRRLNGAVCEQQ